MHTLRAHDDVNLLLRRVEGGESRDEGAISLVCYKQQSGLVLAIVQGKCE